MQAAFGIGRGNYAEASVFLERIKGMNEGKTFFSWHSIALAYTYFKLGQLTEYKQELQEAKRKIDYLDGVS